MPRPNIKKFYIDGAWVDPAPGGKFHTIISPATEETLGEVALGTTVDLDHAVAAARAAFPAFAAYTREDRMALLERILAVYKRRFAEIGSAISEEMGAPIAFASRFQAGAGMGHFKVALDLLKDFPFEETWGTTAIVREPIGVVGMITPWNWPANQVTCKVAGALAAGCTMVLKPSEFAPFSAVLIAEILHEAGVPKGVFNLVNGDGPTVGAAMAAHPGIDCISFTGSTRAGVEVAIRAAPTVKRVGQELGGKSANILLDDCDFEKHVAESVKMCMRNAGQSCNAPTRLLVPKSKLADVERIAKATVEAMKVGQPADQTTELGPVVSGAQWMKIQGFIAKGIEEKATLVVGGAGRPQGIKKGYFVRPTIFSGVTPAMTIAKEEIFGPVLVIMTYDNEADAVRIANDTVYGLAAYVSSADKARAMRVARQLRAGMVHVNLSPADAKAPFGGMKQSGNGREWGRYGIEEFIEVKAIMGAAA